MSLRMAGLIVGLYEGRLWLLRWIESLSSGIEGLGRQDAQISSGR